MSEPTFFFTTPRCTFCDQRSDIELALSRYKRWVEGALVQDVWPEKSPDWRELLISGTHPECWDNMGDPVDDGDDLKARRIASEWHGGQATALYSFVSCGAIDSRLLDEIRSNMKTDVALEYTDLCYLYDYVEMRSIRGPVEGWSSLSW